MGEGKIKNASKCSYDGVDFKSKLELFCYKKLQEAGIEFTYQPPTVELIPSFELNFKCYEDIGRIVRDENKKVKYSTKRFDLNSKIRSISYTPDFTCCNGLFIIETKGYSNESFPLRWKLYKQYLMNIGFKGILMMPENQSEILQCIEIIKENQSVQYP